MASKVQGFHLGNLSTSSVYIQFANDAELIDNALFDVGRFCMSNIFLHS